MKKNFYILWKNWERLIFIKFELALSVSSSSAGVRTLLITYSVYRSATGITARLVSAFVLSRLDYCNTFLAELPVSTLALLLRVMYAAARLVCDLLSRDHVTPALQAVHWLPIKQRIQFKLCLLVHLAINGKAPIYLTEIITWAASITGRAANRSAKNNDLVIQRTKLKFGQRAFSVAGPHIWDQLPTELKITKNTAAFKRKLKTYFFSAACSQ